VLGLYTSSLFTGVADPADHVAAEVRGHDMLVGVTGIENPGDDAANIVQGQRIQISMFPNELDEPTVVGNVGQTVGQLILSTISVEGNVAESSGIEISHKHYDSIGNVGSLMGIENRVGVQDHEGNVTAIYGTYSAPSANNMVGNLGQIYGLYTQQGLAGVNGTIDMLAGLRIDPVFASDTTGMTLTNYIGVYCDIGASYGTTRYSGWFKGAPFRVDNVIEVNGVQVVGDQDTGWGDPTGTSDKGTFDTGTVTLPDLAEFVKAMYEALKAHGLIGN
jgi:formylmethanofuran dehydrogenase subunit C